MPEERRPQQKDEKLQYLKREEIRTMEKDVSDLREAQASKERQKISKIRMGEQEENEEQKQAEAQKESQLREEVIEKSRQKEEELAQLRTKREEIQKAETEQAEKQIEQKRAILREQIQQAPNNEEEERRKFLERVEAKAQGREITQEPTPIEPTPITKPSPLPKPIIPSQPKIPTVTPTPQQIPPAPEIPKPKIPTPPIPQRPLTPEILKPEIPVPPTVIPKPEIQKPAPPPKAEIPKPEIPKPFIPPPPPPAPVPKITPTKTIVTPKAPKKPSNFWIRFVIFLLVLAILGAIGTFWYWYFIVRETQPSTLIQTPTQEQATTTIPASKITDLFTNYGYRIPESPRSISAIVIHSVYSALDGGPYNLNGILKQYELYNVAHHYLIGRNGDVYRVVVDENIAYHAGRGQMPDGRTGVNDFSIGIGVINTEEDAPTQAQYTALAGLIMELKNKYSITDDNILRRQDIITDVENNPSNFDWQYFKLLIF